MSSQVKTLDDAGTRLILAKRIKDDIDSYAVKTYDDGFRWHLGASIIGDSCKRKLWYIYRWVAQDHKTGRVQRLLQRGNLEEARFIEYLEGIGATVWHQNTEGLMYHPESCSYWVSNGTETDIDAELSFDVNFSDDKINHIANAKRQGVKFKQYRVSFLNGHFGGSLDAVIKLPENYGIAEPILGEFKTNGTGRGFTDLTRDGVARSKIPHFTQMSIYGYGHNLQYGAYFNVNKNDDDLHVEIVKLDFKLAEQSISKAESVITSQEPPARISDNPAYLDCKMSCAFKDICHSGAPINKNCRSCANCVPTNNAEFWCNRENGVIPRDFVPKGCDNYLSIVAEKPVTIVAKSDIINSDFEIENVPLPE